MARTASGSCRCAVRGRGRAHPPEAMAAGSSGEAEAQALRQPPVHPCAALQPQSGCHLAAPAQQAPRPGPSARALVPGSGPRCEPRSLLSGPARPGSHGTARPPLAARKAAECRSRFEMLRGAGAAASLWARLRGLVLSRRGAPQRRGPRQAREPASARAMAGEGRVRLALAWRAPCVARGGGVLRVSAGARGAGALDARTRGVSGTGRPGDGLDLVTLSCLDTAREGHETAGTGRRPRPGEGDVWEAGRRALAVKQREREARGPDGPRAGKAAGRRRVRNESGGRSASLSEGGGGRRRRRETLAAP